MLVFLNQEERQQLLISSVSERGWKREHKLEFKMASNRFYIPKVNEFFEGLISLLQQCGNWWGHAEFVARRQEEYQRTLCDLRVTYGRVTESAQENQLTQDLELLMQVMDSRLQSLAKLNSDFHYQGTTEESSTTQNSQLFTLERSGNAERPRYEIRQEQIHGLREALGFRWVDIARMLGMSPRTLSRRGQEFGITLGQQHNVSSWSDTWTILWEAFFQLLHCEFCVVLDSCVLPS